MGALERTKAPPTGFRTRRRGRRGSRPKGRCLSTQKTEPLKEDIMPGRDKTKSPLAGVLEALAGPMAVLTEAALDEEKVVQLCGLVDDDGPDRERGAATLALAGLLTAQSQLKERIDWMIEDARAFGAYSSVKGATVYECHCTRNLLLAFVAVRDPAIATRVVEERKIHWPDPQIWPEGLPRTFAAVFAILTTEADEERVGALGLSWLDSGILPESLETSLQPIFRVLVDFRKETILEEEEAKQPEPSEVS